MGFRITAPILALAVCGLLTNIAITLPSLAAKTTSLQFSTAPSPEHDAIKALMEKEGNVTIADKWLNIAPIDLDGDGIPELFVMPLNTDYFCGDAGCLPELYKKDGAGWTEIDLGLNDFINSAPGDWSIAKTKHNGHLVLVLKESKFSSRFGWDGTAYSSLD